MASQCVSVFPRWRVQLAKSCSELKAREQFVLNALKEKAANSYGYKPSKQDADDFGAIYDSVRKNGQPQGAPAPQSGGATGNWQEWVQ